MDSETAPPKTTVRLESLGGEPFRLFFPLGVLAATIGALLWPLHLWLHVVDYPGPSHAALMANGFFGSFIFGFLGTAGPRLLGVRGFHFWQCGGLFALQASAIGALALGQTLLGHALFLGTLAGFTLLMASRIRHRTEAPPPGLILAPLALLCGAGGSILAILGMQQELDPEWITLQHLLSYQGFVLLPILGVGPFLLPRFFGAQSRQDLPDSGPRPTPDWWREAVQSGIVGGAVLVSFVLEMYGWVHVGPGLRAMVVLLELVRSIPIWKQFPPSGRLSWMLRIGLGSVVLGYLLRTAAPGLNIALLHWTFIGGFALVTLAVATRVIGGHCGERALVQGKGRWLLWSMGLILLAMVTRVSGDFWPKIQPTHYGYGALLWVLGLGTWSWYTLRHVGREE